VEEKPPQKKPIGTVIREKNEQNVKTDCVLTGNLLAASIFGSVTASEAGKSSTLKSIYQAVNSTCNLLTIAQSQPG
jgi:hypothetical protein